MGNICWPCHKIGQGHDLYKLCRVPLPDAYAKFQNHRPFGSGEEDFQRFLLSIAMVAILVM